MWSEVLISRKYLKLSKGYIMAYVGPYIILFPYCTLFTYWCNDLFVQFQTRTSWLSPCSDSDKQTEPWTSFLHCRTGVWSHQTARPWRWVSWLHCDWLNCLFTYTELCGVWYIAISGSEVEANIHTDWPLWNSVNACFVQCHHHVQLSFCLELAILWWPELQNIYTTVISTVTC